MRVECINMWLHYAVIWCVLGSAHGGSVRGVAVDALNMEVFSGSADRTIKVLSHTFGHIH